MTSEPSRYVSTDVSDARVNRLWHRVSERLPESPARSGVARWLVLGAAVTAVAAGAALLLRPHAGSPVALGAASHAEARLETANDSLSMTLVEGSKLSLAAHSEAVLQSNRASAVALVLTRGKLSCDVTHRVGREFTVVARDVEVRVVGTQFSVKAGEGDDPRIEVSVVRGVVEVQSKRRPGIVARVAAGQTWIQHPENSAGQVASSVPVVVEHAPAPGVDVAASNHPLSSPTSLSTAAPAPVASGPTARDLFERASESRRAGDALSAARAYDELLRRHPSDPRAGLSAFELGRLRMDRLRDSAGAAAALERALALNVGPSFREDALARLVSVYAAQANFAACARARDRYLASYPEGVHAVAVKARCGSR